METINFKCTEIYIKNTEWFKCTYNNIITRAKARGLDKTKIDYYTEEHHIIPRCMGGTDDEDNLVLLSFREHVIAHMILSRIYDDNDDLALAVEFLTHVERGGVRIKISSTKWIDELKRHRVGRKLSEETKRKISETRKRNQIRYDDEVYAKAAKSRVGLNMTEESKKKKSEALTGKIVSDETREKLSKAGKRRVQGPDGTIYGSQIECAEALGVCTRTVWKMIHRKPELGYKFLDPNSKMVIGPDRTIYNSLGECSRAIGKDLSTIKKWIEKYPEQGYKYYTETEEGQ